jgi:hypothetical protein
MVRNLNALTLVLLALVGLGTVVSSTAQGAPAFTVEGAAPTDETTLTILKDDEGGTKPKTAHHVLDIYNAAKSIELSITCNEVTGDATVVGSEQSDVTITTPLFERGGAVAPKCSFAGQDTTVENQGCNLTYQASGTVEITSENNTIGSRCAVGEKPIKFAVPNCTVEIGAQTLVNKVRYHNLAGGLVTVETPVGTEADPSLGLTFTAAGTTCPFGTQSTGQYTTGNAIVTGEEKGTSTMVNLKWDALAPPRFTVEGVEAFDETTLTVLKDDEGGTKPKTAHQVFDFYNSAKTVELSLTCNELTADATVVGPEQNDVTLVTPALSGGGTIAPKCTFAGQDVNVENRGCNFTLQAGGEFEITSEGNIVGSRCAPGEKPIYFAIPGCLVEIGAQTFVGSVRYRNLPDASVTVETPTGAVGDPLLGFSFNAEGVNCPFGAVDTGIVTTGNTIITAEKKGTTTMAALRWDSVPPPPAARFTVEGAAPTDETTLTILKDDEGGTKPKTAHHVLDIYNAAKSIELSITCNEVTGDATVVGSEQSDVTITTPLFERGGAVAPKCSFAGQDTTVENQGCNLTYQASGTVEITSENNTIGSRCAVGEKPIKFAVPNCTVEIGAQTLVNKVRYHNLAGGLVTVETPVGTEADPSLGLTFTAAGTTCPFGTQSTGQYTTGNAIVTGEEKGTSTMVNLKWDSV